MLRWFREVWTGSAPVEFESAYGMNESVERLRAATARWGMFRVAGEVAAGRVSESRVSLQRVIPMVGNSFKPFFIGRFERRQGRVVLTGRFTMLALVRLFMLVWFGFVGVFVVGDLLAGLAHPKALAAAPFGLLMLAFGFALLRLGAWLSRNDPAWLSEVIRRALGSTPPGVAAAPPALAARPGARPTPILLITGVLALSGVIACVSAITGVQQYRGDATGAIITHYADERLRYLSGAIGVLALLLAWGVYQRRLLAWRGGFLLIAGAPFMQLYALFRSDVPESARMPAYVFAGLSVLVVALWGRWWYAQRPLFNA